MTRPRVVHVGPSMHARGGIASVLRSYAGSELADRYTLEFVPTVGGGSVPRRVTDSLLGLVRAMRALSRRPRPLVHVHLSMGGSLVRKSIVVAYSKLLGRPVVLHLHGSDFHDHVASGGPLRRVIVRRVFAASDRVLVLSERWRRRVEDFSGVPDAVILPNPVTIPAEVEAKRSSRVVFTGRLGERKGVPVLLEAIRVLQDSGVRASYVIAGDGDVETTCEAVSRLPRPDEVQVPGWLEHDEIESLLGTSAVFCLPSFEEGQPVALLEAMAYGLACVVTPAGGMAETVTSGHDGLVVPAGDARALAAALLDVLGDTALCGRLGAAARSTAIASFSLESAVRRLEVIYTDLGYPPSES